MSLTTDFGPVAAIHYNPTYRQTAIVDGISSADIGGHLPRAAAEELFELVNNRDNRLTIQGRTGVLEWVTSPYPVIGFLNGWYVFQSFVFEPYKFSNGTIAAAFTLQAAYLGDVA